MFVEINKKKPKNISVGDIVINSDNSKGTIIGICSEIYTNDNAMYVFIISNSGKEDVYYRYTTHKVLIADWNVFEGNIRLSNQQCDRSEYASDAL